MAHFRKQGKHRTDAEESHSMLFYAIRATISVCDEVIEGCYINSQNDKEYLEKYKDRKLTHQKLLDYLILVYEDYELFKVFWADEAQKIIDDEKNYPKSFNKIRYQNFFSCTKKFLIPFEYMDLLEDWDIFDKIPQKQSKFKQLLQNLKIL